MRQVIRCGVLLVVLSSCGGGTDGAGSAPPTFAPAAPSLLSVTSTTTARVALAWTDNSSDEQGFAVERSTGAAPFVEIARVGSGTTLYQDATAAANARHSYRVRAFGPGGLSSFSNDATTTTYTPAGVASINEALLLGSRGDEIAPSSSSGVYLGVTYTVTFLGFAFCIPGSPYAPPATTPTPPGNLYGCQNAVVVSLSVSGAIATLIVDVPKLYIDLSTQSSLTGLDPAYLEATGAQLTLLGGLAATPDGRVQLQSIAGQSLTTSATAFHTQDGVVSTLSLVPGLVTSRVQPVMLEVMVTMLTANLAQIPPFIP